MAVTTCGVGTDAEKKQEKEIKNEDETRGCKGVMHVVDAAEMFNIGRCGLPNSGTAVIEFSSFFFGFYDLSFIWLPVKSVVAINRGYWCVSRWITYLEHGTLPWPDSFRFC